MPDRDLSMLVANAIRRRTIDDDVFVRGDREPDMDLEAGPMPMLVARGDHRDATSRDVIAPCSGGGAGARCRSSALRRYEIDQVLLGYLNSGAALS